MIKKIKSISNKNILFWFAILTINTVTFGQNDNEVQSNHETNYEKTLKHQEIFYNLQFLYQD